MSGVLQRCNRIHQVLKRNVRKDNNYLETPFVNIIKQFVTIRILKPHAVESNQTLQLFLTKAIN